MKKILWVTLILLAASFAACTHTGGRSRPTAYSFTVDIPEGWRRIDRPYLLITKEGPFLQNIMVQNRFIGQSFRYTRKKMKQGMLPEEAAQIIIDEFASDQNIGNLKVLNNTPAQGIFRCRMVYSNKLESVEYIPYIARQFKTFKIVFMDIFFI